jgi:hypothetical protein
MVKCTGKKNPMIGDNQLSNIVQCSSSDRYISDPWPEFDIIMGIAIFSLVNKM